MFFCMQKKLNAAKTLSRVCEYKTLRDPVEYHGEVAYVRQTHGIRLWSEGFKPHVSGLDRGIVLCIPGTGESALFFEESFIEELRKKGLRVVRFDLRGYGKSTWPGKDFTLEDLVQDCFAVLSHWISQDVPPPPIFCPEGESEALVGDWAALAAIESAEIIPNLILVGHATGGIVAQAAARRLLLNEQFFPVIGKKHRELFLVCLGSAPYPCFSPPEQVHHPDADSRISEMFAISKKRVVFPWNWKKFKRLGKEVAPMFFGERNKFTREKVEWMKYRAILRGDVNLRSKLPGILNDALYEEGQPELPIEFVQRTHLLCLSGENVGVQRTHLLCLSGENVGVGGLVYRFFSTVGNFESIMGCFAVSRGSPVVCQVRSFLVQESQCRFSWIFWTTSCTFFRVPHFPVAHTHSSQRTEHKSSR